jgi:hypothetical protein
MVLNYSFRASEGTLSRWYLLHLQLSAPTIHLHWARVVGYDPFSLCVIYTMKLYVCACASSNTFITLTIHPRKSSRDTSDIPTRHPHFTKIISYEKYSSLDWW